MSKAITLTFVVNGNSLNYGETNGNYTELKKLNRGDGNTYTYSSRQSLRYSVVKMGNELFGWNLDTVGKGTGDKKGVLQFKADVTIKDSVEMDLFGYMRTKKGSSNNKRSAPVRINHAISIEPYKYDTDYLNNLGFAARIEANADLATLENHKSLYTYTVTIDLDRIGLDTEDNIELSFEEKAERVQQLLTILKLLYRDIKGRREDLSPVFVVGGMYDVANPFFMNRISVKANNQGFELSINILKEAFELSFGKKTLVEDTRIGMVSHTFTNDEEIRQIFENKVMTIEQLFRFLNEQVENYYFEKVDV